LEGERAVANAASGKEPPLWNHALEKRLATVSRHTDAAGRALAVADVTTRESVEDEA